MNLIDYHGRLFSAIYRTEQVVGKITVENGEVFLCQNSFSGSNCREKHGFKYSWSFGHLDEENMNVDFINRHFSDVISEFSFLHEEVKYPRRKSNLIMSYNLFELLNSVVYVRVKEDLATAGIELLDGNFTDGNNFIHNNIKRGVKDANCFDIKDGQITYSTGVQALNSEGKWDEKSRQTIKSGKFLSLFTDFIMLKSGGGDIQSEEKLKKRAIELYASLIASDKANVLISDDVNEVYKMRTSKSPTGTLGVSCMRSEADYKGKNFINIYNDIPKLKIAYTLDIYGDLTSRALLWHDALDMETAEEFTFMDRIYGTEKSIAGMLKWAKENKYCYKREQSYRDPTLIETDNKLRTNFNVKVPFDHTLSGSPFLDTLNIFDFDEGYLRSRSQNRKYEVGLTMADGCIHIRRLLNCPICGEEIFEDETVVAIDTERRVCVRHLRFIDYLGIRGGYYENTKVVNINNRPTRVPEIWVDNRFEFNSDKNSFILKTTTTTTTTTIECPSGNYATIGNTTSATNGETNYATFRNPHFFTIHN